MRDREIWTMSEQQDWDEYLRNKIQIQAKDRQEFRENVETQKKHIVTMNNSKILLEEIRRKWKNEHIKIITEEIREGQKKGNARIVWRKINELKQPKQNIRHGNMVLKDKDGNIQSETHINLTTMRSYIKEHFTRVREDWKINCITAAAWHNKEQLDAQIGKGSEFDTKHKNSKLQQYADSNTERRKQIDNLGNPIDENEIKRAITKLSNRKSVGYDELTAEIFKANSEWLTPHNYDNV